MKDRLTKILKDHKGFVSGSELSLQLGVTRAAVWKQIEELRAAGYEIKAATRRGYHLVFAPDLLSPAELTHHLGTRSFGRHIHHFDSVDSTMVEAFRLGMENAPEGTVVVAETQTRGRGRMGRLWSSPKGKGLYFSIILRPSCAPSDAARLTLLAAVAVSEAVERNTGIRSLIKWPNDLLIDGKKVCGILTELNAEVDRIRFVVVGVGLNVNASASQIPLEATSIKQAAGRAFSRVALLQEILRAFEERYQAAMKAGYSSVLAEWRLRSAMDGRQVRFQDRGKDVTATVVGLHDDGGLLVKLADGSIDKRIAGDVML